MRQAFSFQEDEQEIKEGRESFIKFFEDKLWWV